MRLRLTPFLGVAVLATVGISNVWSADRTNLRAEQASVAHFSKNRAAYGLTQNDTVAVRSSRTDEHGRTHVRVEQSYKGVRVFEGEAITHINAKGRVTVTDSLARGIDVNVNPTVSRAEAINRALDEAAPRGAHEVRASLEILSAGDRSAVNRLVWHVTVGIENIREEPRRLEVFVDGHVGDVVLEFDSLETGVASKGTGNTMYTGTQTLDTDFASGTYSLTDDTRGGGNYTCDMNNRQGGKCSQITRSTNVFGNGSKDNTDRATAGADAHSGLQATWSYFKDMFGRNGIDGTGRKTYSRVHFGASYQNANWNSSCFCMTYGDGGTTFYPLVSVDIAGHEMAHGVNSTEANLTYSGESGGLNESSSDIFGAMVEYKVNSTLDTPDYWIGERIYRSNWNGSTYNQTKALRYMDDPFKDGASPACWSSTVGSLDVHYSSGPNNHMFYLLAEGGTSKCNGSNVSGIGRDAAARIWYKALSDYMTASTNYHGARTAALNAAAALYGTGSAQYNGVNAAYAAINVN